MSWVGLCYEIVAVPGHTLFYMCMYVVYAQREAFSDFSNSISAYASVLDKFPYVGIIWLKHCSVTGPLQNSKKMCLYVMGTN